MVGANAYFNINPVRIVFVNFFKLYLEIEKTRFGERLDFEEELDEESLDVNVPNMILQPLYENAIKHGVYESTETVHIKLKTQKPDAAILISISNDYDPETIAPGGTGTGLNNVRRRLELYYGNRAWLKTLKDNRVFRAELYIPEKSDKQT